MEKLYTVALVGADHLPAPRRIALETRFAQELEGFLGSPKEIRSRASRAVLVPGGWCVGGEPPTRLERGVRSAQSAVWASLGGEQGAHFRLNPD